MNSQPGSRGTYNSAVDPLYKALDAYEEAAGAVGVQTITTQGAYRQLTDAIGGHGDLSEASARFTLEASILVGMHGEWSEKARALSAEAADALRWQQVRLNVLPRRCANCGSLLAKSEGATCSDCISNAIEGREQSSDFSLAEAPHIDNVLYEETIDARERADEDAAATRAYYGA